MAVQMRFWRFRSPRPRFKSGPFGGGASLGLWDPAEKILVNFHERKLND